MRFAPLAALVLLGCSSHPEPRAVAEAAHVRQTGPTGSLLDISVRAANFGPEPLPLVAVRYRVYLDGREVFEGTRSAEATLSRFGERSLRLPAVTTDPPGSQWRVEGTIEYVPPGAFARALTELGLARRTLRFEGSGTFAR